MTIPASWLPAATMTRVILHWSAGAHTASALDRAHYHFILEGDGNAVRGDRSIRDNEGPIRGNYAAHTRACNTGSIGVSLACMAGATESPFRSGRYPMTETQWDAMIDFVADLCRAYAIEPTPETVLSHAEVEGNLGIWQRGKWDYTRLSFDASIKGAREIGDRIRMAVRDHLAAGIVDREIEEPLGGNRGEPTSMALYGSTTAPWLNFRRAPMGDIIGGLPRGTSLTIQDVDEGWYQARTPAGYLGWVSAHYVRLD